jgi:hypothetical protein
LELAAIGARSGVAGSPADGFRSLRLSSHAGTCIAIAQSAAVPKNTQNHSVADIAPRYQNVTPLRDRRRVTGCCTDCSRLCPSCRADHFACLRGVAACRGETWARRVAARCDRNRPWPRSERSHAIARQKVADITSDDGLRDLLATEAENYAARWWGAS